MFSLKVVLVRTILLGGCAQKRATQAAAGNVSYSFRSLRNLIAVS